MERGADLRPEQGIVEPALRLVDVELGRHDVVVAGEHDRGTGGQQLRGVCGQTVEPAQLVVEFWPGGWIAVG